MQYDNASLFATLNTLSALGDDETILHAPRLPTISLEDDVERNAFPSYGLQSTNTSTAVDKNQPADRTDYPSQDIVKNIQQGGSWDGYRDGLGLFMWPVGGLCDGAVELVDGEAMNTCPSVDECGGKNLDTVLPELRALTGEVGEDGWSYS
ncbi:hypothetical protein DAEQUDRAFT_723731 [Daedalea quercina L-15889]|uniref:Uncharacterized protein n=1 Tax=Daedalea quercina L-15889 TaxID=1314783 RepID=A0A165S8P9_9APHY|nr:hypothetical protein DAEQUDRAFT_723731 [Daedalea quercina L-15889]